MEREEADRLWDFVNTMQARLEATCVVLNCAVASIKHDPNFALLLQNERERWIANRLGHAVNEKFLEEGKAWITNLTPEEFRPQPG